MTTPLDDPRADEGLVEAVREAIADQLSGYGIDHREIDIAAIAALAAARSHGGDVMDMPLGLRTKLAGCPQPGAGHSCLADGSYCLCRVYADARRRCVEKDEGWRWGAGKRSCA